MSLTKIQPAGIDSSNSTLTLGTSNVTAITIDGSQNVGIGTSSPTSYVKLTVNGATQVSGAIGSIASVAPAVISYEYPITRAYVGDGTGYSWAFSKRASSTTTDLLIITDSGNFQHNSGYGSAATAYGCRAWVNFNGSTAAIRASGGVTSVTRNTTGDYTINFSITLPDVNYSYSIGWDYPSATTNEVKGAGAKNTGIATTSLRILYLRQTVSSGSTQDSDILNAAVAVFR